jgi:hypothetical protein
MPPLAAAAEIGGEAGAAGAEGAGGAGGGLGGMLKDFNDNPVSKIGGSLFGKIAHEFTGAIGTGGGDQEKANIGPIGTIA